MRAIKSYNYLFIDESGEFGVSPESSDGLIVVALKTNEVRPIEKVARKVWVSTGLDKSKAQEIHAADANDRIITKALSLLNKQEIQVDVLVYKKRKRIWLLFAVCSSICKKNKKTKKNNSNSMGLNSCS